MPKGIAILLDQNIPRPILAWLQEQHPDWKIYHTADEAMARKSDRDIFHWAQKRKAMIITFDEDFADQRSFPIGAHCGIIRLHVWPTTIEETKMALIRLFSEVNPGELGGALVIIDRYRIRLRKPKK